MSAFPHLKCRATLQALPDPSAVLRSEPAGRAGPDAAAPVGRAAGGPPPRFAAGLLLVIVVGLPATTPAFFGAAAERGLSTGKAQAGEGGAIDKRFADVAQSVAFSPD